MESHLFAGKRHEPKCPLELVLVAAEHPRRLHQHRASGAVVHRALPDVVPVVVRPEDNDLLRTPRALEVRDHIVRRHGMILVGRGHAQPNGAAFREPLQRVALFVRDRDSRNLAVISKPAGSGLRQTARRRAHPDEADRAGIQRPAQFFGPVHAERRRTWGRRVRHHDGALHRLPLLVVRLGVAGAHVDQRAFHVSRRTIRKGDAVDRRVRSGSSPTRWVSLRVHPFVLKLSITAESAPVAANRSRMNSAAACSCGVPRNRGPNRSTKSSTYARPAVEKYNSPTISRSISSSVTIVTSSVSVAASDQAAACHLGLPHPLPTVDRHRVAHHGVLVPPPDQHARSVHGAPVAPAAVAASNGRGVLRCAQVAAGSADAAGACARNRSTRRQA